MKTMMRFGRAGFLLWLVTFAAGLALPHALRAAVCTIQIGSGGSTTTLTYDLTGSVGQSVWWTNLTARDFVRNTSGPCHFYIYNGSNLDGSFVILGSSLAERIRAGVDGLENKDSGGGDTWKIRSVKIVRVDTACRLRIGGNGIRMTYHLSSDLRYTPKMNRMSYLEGDANVGCQAYMYNSNQFGVNDYYNRNKVVKNMNGVSTDYDPGFFVRSLYVQRLTDSGCAERDRGRCVPQTNTYASLYTNQSGDAGGYDRDRDGLHDYYENVVAQAFRPAFYNHSTEDATRKDLYLDSANQPIDEPSTVFQVRPNGANQIIVQYNVLWYYDSGCSVPFSPHQGDFGKITLYLRTTDGGRHWYVYQTSMHEDGSNWVKDSGQVRSTRFEYWGSSIASHPVALFMKGKHHNYSDGGWSGVGDVKSGSASPCTCLNNARGYQIDLPGRLAGLYLPLGATSASQYAYTNVGRSAYPFLNQLGIFSSLYAGQYLWGDPAFFDSDAAARGFQ